MSAPPSTRERILAGAAKAFSSKGCAAARVEDILVAADVSRPTFYKFFEGKDAVFEELSRIHHAQILGELVAATAAAHDATEKLDKAMEAFLRWRAELGPIGRVLDTEARVPNSRLHSHRSGVLDAVVERLQAEMRAAGRDEVDPLVLRALVAACENVADSFLAEKRVGVREFERRKAVLSRILRATLAVDGEAVPALPRPPGSPAASRAGAARAPRESRRRSPRGT